MTRQSAHWGLFRAGLEQEAVNDIMEIYNHCTMTTLYHSEDPSENGSRVVKLDKDRILVEYEDGGQVQYEGKGNGEGHFELNGVGFHGRASLHMFPGSSVLEGTWVEEGYHGMWRIKVA